MACIPRISQKNIILLYQAIMDYLCLRMQTGKKPLTSTVVGYAFILASRAFFSRAIVAISFCGLGNSLLACIRLKSNLVQDNNTM